MTMKKSILLGGPLACLLALPILQSGCTASDIASADTLSAPSPTVYPIPRTVVRHYTIFRPAPAKTVLAPRVASAGRLTAPAWRPSATFRPAPMPAFRPAVPAPSAMRFAPAFHPMHIRMGR